MTTAPFDALLLVSFGGPEGRDDVLPFLNNVLRGRNVPEQRKLEVAEHYYRFGGVSPINGQNRQLLQAVQADFLERGIELPVYWGNRNWHPMLADTLHQMKADGIEHALALITSPFSSYSSCRQYLQAIAAARTEVGAGAPRVSKLRAFFNHPRFVEAWCERAKQGLEKLGGDSQATRILFTAHSIPTAMAQASPYQAQLRDLAKLIASRLDLAPSRCDLVYQSRSGPPQQPWLEPDVCDAISALADRSDVERALLVPIGFVSDHVEVLFDLDVEAAEAAARAGIQLVRTETVGTHPLVVAMVRELTEERLCGARERPVCGTLGAAPDVCPVNCCAYEMKRPQSSR